MGPKKMKITHNPKKLEDERQQLLAQSLQWQDELSKIGRSTAAPATVTKSLVGQVATIAHGLVAATDTNAQNLAALNKDCSIAVNSAETALAEATSALQSQIELDSSLKSLVATTDKQAKQIDTNAKRAAKNATDNHREALNRCQTVLIAKGIPPLHEGKETYAELEAALDRCLKTLKLDKGKLGVDYLRRLPEPKMTDAQKRRSRLREGPRLLRIQLGSLGDKIKVFEAMTALADKNKMVDFSFSTEVPRYALPRFKKLGRAAKALRQIEVGIKTRVVIPKGKINPVLQIKSKGTTEDYVDASEEMLARAQRRVADEDKEEQLLEEDPVSMNTE